MSKPDETGMNSTLPEWCEPFPKPQTMPSGWDLSALAPAHSLPSVIESDPSAED